MANPGGRQLCVFEKTKDHLKRWRVQLKEWRVMMMLVLLAEGIVSKYSLPCTLKMLMTPKMKAIPKWRMTKKKSLNEKWGQQKLLFFSELSLPKIITCNCGKCLFVLFLLNFLIGSTYIPYRPILKTLSELNQSLLICYSWYLLQQYFQENKTNVIKQNKMEEFLKQIFSSFSKAVEIHTQSKPLYLAINWGKCQVV